MVKIALQHFQAARLIPWQVMVTTHSPVFIDLSRNVTGTTIYRPTKAKLSPDEKEEFELPNMYDPHVAEFFFGGRTVIVEGDTEHSAFKEIIHTDTERFKEVHVVRARGKYTVIALCKILNQFGNPYAIRLLCLAARHKTLIASIAQHTSLLICTLSLQQTSRLQFAGARAR